MDLQVDDGIVLLDKAAGISSAKALARIKAKLGVDKIGHSGTLDPFATGLLVCLIGKATRLARFAEQGRKRYRGVITLGIRSATDDITGEILERSDAIPAEEQVRSAALNFKGEISQVPPQISAVKVDGERSYRRARRGEVVALQPRKVTIFELALNRLSERDYQLVVECSAGTYIRSIARDLGEILGCGAVLSSLRREYSHPLSIEQAKPEEAVSVNDIQPWSLLFPTAPRIVLPSQEARRLSSGDQSILGELSRQDEFNKMVANQRCAIYVDAATRAVGGLLEQDGSRWVVGVNFGG